MKTFLLIVFILGFLILAGCNRITGAFVGPTCETVQVPYEEQEPYQDREPYTDKECHDEELKFTINWGDGRTECTQEQCAQHQQSCVQYTQECARYNRVCVDTNFWGNCVEFEDQCAEYKDVCVREISACVRNECIKYQKTCELKIKNIDDVRGIWKVDALWVDENNEEHNVGEKSLMVQPTETGSIFWTYIFSRGSSTQCKYSNVRSPTKSVCENVIKYRDVTKYRTVTKYRSEEHCE